MKEGFMSEVSGGAPSAPGASAPAAAPTSNAPESMEQLLGEGQAGQTPEQKAQAEQVKQEIKVAKKKLQLKVHGQDREVEFDPNDDKYMKHMLEKAMGADKVFEEGAMTKKQMNQLVQMLQDKTGLWDVISQAGHNADDLVSEYMERRLAEVEKSPQQKDLEKAQAELEKERKMRKTYEEEKMTSENQRVQDEYARNLNTEIEEAFKDLQDLPKSAYTVKRLASTIAAYLDKGVEISVKDAVQIVRKENTRELQEMFNQMPEEIIEQLLGEGNNKRLRARRVAKAKEMKTASQIKATGHSEIQRQLDAKPQEKVKASDFFRKLK